jgi:polysaccharide export outer membrane protein
LCIWAFSGCQEPPVINVQAERTADHKQATQAVEEFTLQSGDTVKISFPGAPNLDTQQQIRSDGRITLPMLGEVVASSKTPVALEKELKEQFAPQLVSKEVSVAVVAAPFAVFVSGAVQRPGKIVADHPISALEAIMEAGGFDNAKANMSAVVVIRQNGTSSQSFTLDLKQVLEGKKVEAFYLRRSDIVQVPEKFTWF